MKKTPCPARTVFSKTVIAIVTLWLFCDNVHGQEVDSSRVEQYTDELSDELTDEERIPGYKDPNKALLMALAFPGGGQIYNEKVWKVPLIYGGILTSIYFFEFNNRRYKQFLVALDIIRDPRSTAPNPFPNLNQDGIIRNVNFWRKNRDSMFLVFAGIYALGAVDAFVDAHLSGFDISDDLSFSIEPSVEPLLASNAAVGVSFKIKF